MTRQFLRAGQLQDTLRWATKLFGFAQAMAKELDESELNKKQEAISAYTSQKYLWGIFLEKHPELLGREYFSKLH